MTKGKAVTAGGLGGGAMRTPARRPNAGLSVPAGRTPRSFRSGRAAATPALGLNRTVKLGAPKKRVPTRSLSRDCVSRADRTAMLARVMAGKEELCPVKRSLQFHSAAPAARTARLAHPGLKRQALFTSGASPAVLRSTQPKHAGTGMARGKPAAGEGAERNGKLSATRKGVSVVPVGQAAGLPRFELDLLTPSVTTRTRRHVARRPKGGPVARSPRRNPKAAAALGAGAATPGTGQGDDKLARSRRRENDDLNGLAAAMDGLLGTPSWKRVRREERPGKATSGATENRRVNP
eukprot:CAMPEP_0119136734 /NCGR_PEP_ID=MMETSP1310-20130426/22013_1 /TAXON_ID=464262 /ORGANISM="Genus nov. species nov., Strain RCC2339" /LENGTH=292 /DNA_ID=CAMNT_0007127757 /DNA_START=41 /DNA_END=916 /DNA_ORIENTATION=-